MPPCTSSSTAGYRAYSSATRCAAKPSAWPLTGWVRNTADGAVEAMVQGEKAAVADIVQWAHRGPERAQVSKVEVAPGNGAFHQFEILY